MQRPSSITVTAPVPTVPTARSSFTSAAAYRSASCKVRSSRRRLRRSDGQRRRSPRRERRPASSPRTKRRMHQGANAIVTTAALRAEIASVVPALQSKGIVISDCCSTDPVASPFIYNTSTPSQSGAIGKALAAEVVANSNGKANTLYVNIPAFTILSSLASTFKQAYSQYCPTCGYASIDVGLTQLAIAPNLIVSYLRSHRRSTTLPCRSPTSWTPACRRPCRLRVCRTSRSSVRAAARPTSSTWPAVRSWRSCHLTTTPSITRWSTRSRVTSPGCRSS